jgi:CubicO group peptidase (beta-lactamase class C family)
MTGKRIQRIIVAVLLSLLFLGRTCEPIQASTSLPMTTIHAIDTYITSQMQRLHIPGIALGIVHKDQIIYAHGYGVAGPTGRPMTAHTPFVLASISKSFTALAVMQEVAQGKIALDAPVQRYIPWFHVATPGASSRITIRNLLTHTSGFSPYLGGIHPAAPGESIEKFVRAMRTTTLTAPVGTKFQYSNANYAVLGLVVQMVSGEPYGVYIQQQIFAPLQMHESFTSQAAALKHGLTTGYQTFFGAVLPVNAPYHLDIQPAGYLISSAADMTHYLIAQMKGGRYGATSILSQVGMEHMHAPEVITQTTRGLVERVRNLATATTRFADRTYTQRVSVSRNDEIGLLEHQFQCMAEQLAESIAQREKLAEQNARLAERARISRELHDAISQDLFSLRMATGGLQSTKMIRFLEPLRPVLSPICSRRAARKKLWPPCVQPPGERACFIQWLQLAFCEKSSSEAVHLSVN